MSANYKTINVSNKSLIHAQKRKIEAQTKSVIKTVIERCKKEKDNNHLILPLEEYEERVSYYTGFPKTYIYKLTNNVKINSELSGISLHVNILKCLKDFYLQSEYPSYKTVYQTLLQKHLISEKILFPEFQQHMVLLDFHIRKTMNGYLVVEDSDKAFERFRYLNKIRKYREQGKIIYYIDERIIDMKLSFPRPDTTSNGKLVLFHMISGHGYESGLFCYYPTTEEFLKWIVDIVLPSLQHNSVIVLNDSPFHNISDTILTGYSSKKDMLEWLRENNIPCSAKMRKAELYQLITKCTNYREKRNVLHCALRANSHTVLQLPSNLNDLSPIELFWNNIRNRLNSTLSKELKVDHMTLKTSLGNVVGTLPSSSYKDYESIIEAFENELYTIDAEIEEALEIYKFDVSISDLASSSHQYDYVDSD